MACYREKMPDGRTAFLCGKLAIPHCDHPNCGASAEYLCDYPIGNGKKCNSPLCNNHAYEAGQNKHYCTSHLENISLFKKPKGKESIIREAVVILEKMEAENE